MDNPSCEWRWVKGFEGWYEVSSTGLLRRTAPGRSTRPGKFVKGYLDRKGYRRTTITANGMRRAAGFHVLVAEAFLDARPAGRRLVRHLNGCKSDNRADNLEWGDDSDNAADEVSSGRSKSRKSRNRDKTHCPRGHEYTPENTRTDSLGRRYCRACRRERWGSTPPLQPDDPRHGSANGYLNLKCRCAPCRSAYTIYRAQIRNKQ